MARASRNVYGCANATNVTRLEPAPEARRSV